MTVIPDPATPEIFTYPLEEIAEKIDAKRTNPPPKRKHAGKRA